MAELRIYLTGSRGYIGSYMLDYLRNDRSDRHTKYDHILHRSLKKVKVYENTCDITCYDELLSELQEVKPNVVIHLAARSTVPKCNKNPQKAFLVNAIGTKNLIKAMVQVRCYNIVYASTCAVYGNSNKPKWEDDKLMPCSTYGITKLLGELCIYQNKKINSVIFRMSNVSGLSVKCLKPRDRLFGVLNKLSNEKDQSTITIYGKDYVTKDGSCDRDYIHLEDVCFAYRRAAEMLFFRQEGYKLLLNLPLRCNIMNLAMGHNYTVKQIIDIWNYHLYKYKNKLIATQYGCRRFGDPDTILMNTNRLYITLGFKATRSIDEIIESYLK